jgi:hypothetical protein
MEEAPQLATSISLKRNQATAARVRAKSEQRPDNLDSLRNDAIQASVKMLEKISAFMKTNGLIILPTASGPTQWSPSNCRLIESAVHSVLCKLCDVERKYSPRSACTFRDRIFSRDIEFCLEKTTQESYLYGDLTLLSDCLYTLLHWLVHIFV